MSIIASTMYATGEHRRHQAGVRQQRVRARALPARRHPGLRPPDRAPATSCSSTAARASDGYVSDILRLIGIGPLRAEDRRYAEVAAAATARDGRRGPSRHARVATCCGPARRSSRRPGVGTPVGVRRRPRDRARAVGATADQGARRPGRGRDAAPRHGAVPRADPRRRRTRTAGWPASSSSSSRCWSPRPAARCFRRRCPPGCWEI